jgi:hypothetical protein
VTLSPSVGLWGQAAGKTAESFRGLRAIGGAPHGAARRRRRRRSPDIHPGASRPIVTAIWFRRSCRAENGGTKQRPESAPEEMSFPVLPPEATPIPSVRGLRRTRRNGSSEGLRISLRGSNRVTCGGRKEFSFGARGILPLLLGLSCWSVNGGVLLLTRHFLKGVQNQLAVFLFGLTQQAAEFAYVLCILA